ncbi:helix-turn-helix domain-containing protein [Paenibacillus polymyxa]|uniref:helix-turn-helix domain-containing protein n=1 Tax=Paenibacillus polymyxa TaxID=1406 RepID=UPI00046F3279|nr:AraC family transcriptional regulator [Paenibacillus polymyxa]
MNSNSLSLIYQHYLEKTPFRQQNEHTYMILPEAGHGHIYRVTTYSGIEIVYSHIQYHEPYPTNFASSGQMIELQFALSGQRHVNVAGLDYTLPMGQGALIFLQDFKACFHPPVNEQYQSFALGIPISLFNYAASQLAARRQVAIEFNQILKGAAFHHFSFELDHRSIVMIEHLIKDLKSVHKSPLLMEGAALEILNRFMIQLFDLTPMPEGLSKEDVRKLHMAREILESSMIDPPSLITLSQKVGLNDFKLKKGFKACFGTTVFEYLRQIRLDYAMKLLRSQESNVTEAAMAVGYSNVSAFSEQFFREYGVKPSSLKKVF